MRDEVKKESKEKAEGNLNNGILSCRVPIRHWMGWQCKVEVTVSDSLPVSVLWELMSQSSLIILL